MIYTIPTSQTEPLYSQVTALDGTSYLWTFAWNVRDGRWYFDLLDQDGVLITGGVRVVVGSPLLSRCLDPRRPLGTLMAIDTTGESRDPAFDELGTRVLLTYFPVGTL